ncbi:DUF397 domain-containing protein [Streptomyces netropsis]|uniref:DUF397 domain-containing protein n=1 Tax=Streptomyces netropsis TaxID=55404 RepID=A0A7W7PI15_STRNE|nr:DUF397 domain-containing protein [Streptomyces netropsis]MBB4890567.1 hypothetical protein [Streptomyces netropsis]GGR50263.1 hypothetical protein GCM10010219_64480 [Streptomyces netropsis]
MHAIRPGLSPATWRKSSHSNEPGGDCVEIADNIPGTVLVRDSKHPHGPALALPATAWTAFVATLSRRQGTCSATRENLSPRR